MFFSHSLKKGEGNNLYNLGIALHRLGKINSAMKFVKQALNIYEEFEMPAAEKTQDKIYDCQSAG